MPCSSVLSAVIGLALVTPLSAQDTSLGVGERLTGTLDSEASDGFSFDVDADSFVRAVVDQVSVDVVVRVIAPDGATLASIDGPARGDERVTFKAESAGTYRFEVSPFEEERGDYTVELLGVEPAASDAAGRARQLMADYEGDSPGAVISVWRDDSVVFQHAVGMANLTYDVPFTVDTPTNIGSTSKQFTAFAMCLLDERGELSLDDDVRVHIPELPDFGETVTLRHLITHTTGFREFLNLLSMSGRRLDRGDHIGREELVEIVQSQPALQNSPGAEWNYNNTAFGLAALVVERVSEMTFAEFLEAEAFGPLGMTNSRVRMRNDEIVPGASMGYVPSDGGVYLEARDIAGSTGAGGIYSTVGDLQLWTQNFTDPTVGSQAIFNAMTTPYTLTDGNSTGYGFGLFLDSQRGLDRIHHGGADIAHRSELIYFPEINAGITVQSNHASFDTSLAVRLAGEFFSDAMEPAPEDTNNSTEEPSDYDVASFENSTFDELAGRYALGPSFVLNVFREGDSYFAQATGQGRTTLVPTSDSTFNVPGVGAISFHKNDAGETDALTLHQGGDHRATRLVEEKALPDLTAFTGRYLSDELEIFATVKLVDGALVVDRRRVEDATLSHTAGDEFSEDGTQIEFERDRTGSVIAFYVSNGRTRDVRFARVR